MDDYQELYEKLCRAERDMRENKCDHRVVEQLAEQVRRARIRSEYEPPLMPGNLTKQQEEFMEEYHERAKRAKKKLDIK